MHSTWYSNTFLSFLNFSSNQIEDLSFLGVPIPQNGWIIYFPFQYFNFKNLKQPNFSGFIRFQCIPHDCAVLLSILQNFLKLKRGDRTCWMELILTVIWIILSLLLYFNFKYLKDPHSLWFIRLQCSLHGWEVLSSGFEN